MVSVRLTISLEDSLAKSIDQLRGDVPRSAYIKNMIKPIVKLREAKLKKVSKN